MKKLIVSLLIATTLSSTVAVAEPRDDWRSHGHIRVHGGWWGPEAVIAGVIIGGALVEEFQGRRIDINDTPPPGYERVKICQVENVWNGYQYVTEQVCHIEWRPIPTVYQNVPPPPPPPQQ
jgi:hypothetical protein